MWILNFSVCTDHSLKCINCTFLSTELCIYSKEQEYLLPFPQQIGCLNPVLSTLKYVYLHLHDILINFMYMYLLFVFSDTDERCCDPSNKPRKLYQGTLGWISRKNGRKLFKCYKKFTGAVKHIDFNMSSKFLSWCNWGLDFSVN